MLPIYRENQVLSQVLKKFEFFFSRKNVTQDFAGQLRQDRQLGRPPII
jgi:hypothetical protein